MPALVADIHVFAAVSPRKTWMAGTSPAMTRRYRIVPKRRDQDRRPPSCTTGIFPTLAEPIPRTGMRRGGKATTHHEARFLHHADPSARQGLADIAARGPRGVPPGGQARLRRGLCRRA